MGAGDGSDLPFQKIGLYDRVADPEHIAAFRQALAVPLEGRDPVVEDAVPVTYPISWLGQPDIRAAIKAVIGADETAPDPVMAVHVAQSLDYRTAIAPGATYTLDVGWRPAPGTDRVEVGVDVTDAAGEPVLWMSSILFLVAMRDATP